MLEADGGGVADGAGHAAAMGRSLGDAVILNHPQRVPLGDVHDGVHVRRTAGPVNDHDGFRAGCNLAFHVRGVEGEGNRIDVGKDRHRAAADNRQAVEGMDGRLRNDLVARRHANAEERRPQRRRA